MSDEHHQQWQQNTYENSGRNIGSLRHLNY